MTMHRARDFDRWVRLTLAWDGDVLQLSYEDEGGVRTGAVAAVRSSQIARDFGRLHRGTVEIPAKLGAWLKEGFADRAERRDHLLPAGSREWQKPVPWLLPVFIRPPEGYSGLPWERWIEQLLLKILRLPARCVVMREVAITPLPPLRLPIQLSSVVRPNVDMFRGVHRADWYRDSLVDTHGLKIDSSAQGKTLDADIVFRMLGQRLPRVSTGTRPRLIVTMALNNPWLENADAPPLEPGVSHLLVTSLRDGLRDEAVLTDIVTHFVYALVHDFGIHEIAWIISQCVPSLSTWVATDVGGNRTLRLSTVMRDMLDATREGYYRGMTDQLHRLNFDFTRETRGLTSMSRFVQDAALYRLLPEQPKLAFAYESLPVAPAAAVPSERRVDVSVDTYDAFGVIEPLYRHDRTTPLRRGWRYRLRVHIGSPDPQTSAMVGEVPHIDALLPPNPEGEGRILEVVVFAKTFQLLSPAVQQLTLPAEGSTKPVYFELRAPQDLGKSDLRIAIYWNNNLLQSFVLEAQVGSGGTTARSRQALQVRLDSSGIGKFDDLRGLGPRALSVGLNDDSKPGNHTLMLKGTGWNNEIRLGDAEMNEKMEEFLALLEAAQAQGDPARDGIIRRLAALGGQIHDMLALSDQNDYNVLDSLRHQVDQTLQFVRHHDGRPFPWQTIYDYVLPEGDAFVTARICAGGVAPVRQPSPHEVGCPHCPGENVICIEGFWVVRHRLELLSEKQLPTGAAATRAMRASAPRPNPLVALGIGTPSLHASALKDALAAMLAGDAREITKDDAPVVDWLWHADRRPAMLMLLSHLFPKDSNKNLQTRLNAFHPDSPGAGISAHALATRRSKGIWKEDARPLVLLLACQSAERATGDLTSLVDDFLRCGAAGVIGTEWNVPTDLVADFARHLVRDILVETPPLSLGRAMQRFARAQLAARNISPFIVTAYGSADLTVGRPE